jgi:hypothetical protein
MCVWVQINRTAAAADIRTGMLAYVHPHATVPPRPPSQTEKERLRQAAHTTVDTSMLEATNTKYAQRVLDAIAFDTNFFPVSLQSFDICAPFFQRMGEAHAHWATV